MAIYNYLQHLEDVTIDLTEYLTDFSDDNYDLKMSNYQPVEATLANLFQHNYLVKDFKDQGASFFKYNVVQGELPEDVALKHYGNVASWWIVFLFNGIQNALTEWPMSEVQLLYLRDALVVKENRWSPEGYFRLLTDVNETRAKLEILNAEQVPLLVNQFRNTILSSNRKTTTTTTIL